MKAPPISQKQILAAFENLCRVCGVTSAGFDRTAITAPCDGPLYDGKVRWAIKYEPALGYIIVCGAGGCGVKFVRCDGYIRTKWDFLMFLEALAHANYAHYVHYLTKRVTKE